MNRELVILYIVIVAAAVVAIKVREGGNYLSPDDGSFLTDSSIETCTRFLPAQLSQSPNYTTFRIPVPNEQRGPLNVTMTGQNLACAHDLHVMEVSAAQTAQWEGIWLTCPLIRSTKQNSSETCLFHCWCQGRCAEIQISKRPQKAEESSWSLCHLQINQPPTGPLFVTGCDDSHVIQDGIYQVKLEKTGEIKNIHCYLDQEGKKWMIIMRRNNGSVTFIKDWNAYKNGFGFLSGEFWAGNELVSQLMSQGKTYTLRVNYSLNSGKYWLSIYDNFVVGPESTSYKLSVSKFSSDSTGVDGLAEYNNMKFSTADKDNDQDDSRNCAEENQAGWWFKDCDSVVTLTGIYNQQVPRGVSLKGNTNSARRITYVSMMFLSKE